MGIRPTARRWIGRWRGEDDVVTVFMSRARGGLDADTGRDTGQHDLGHPAVAQVGVEGGLVERAPPLLRDPIVIGLCAELVGEIGPVRGGVTGGRLASVSPGAPPATVTSTTGKPRRRQAVARRAARCTISATGCAAGMPSTPFWRSITTSAGCVSSVVSAIIVLFLGTAPGAVAAVIRVVMWVRPFITGARRSSEQRPYLPGSTVAWDRALSSPCPRSTVGWAESTGRGSVRGSGLWSSVAWGTARPPQQWVGGGQEDLCRPVAIHAYVLYFGKPGMLKERVAGRGAALHRAGFEMAGGYDAMITLRSLAS